MSKWLAFSLAFSVVLTVLLSPACRAQKGALGVDVNADVDAFGHAQMDRTTLRDFAAYHTVDALPLCNLPPGDHPRYWDSMATGTGIKRRLMSAAPKAGLLSGTATSKRFLRMSPTQTAGNPQCVSTFVEGFDDYWENATCWRARDLDENGRPLGYAETGYDYPNQRINILRRHSRNPFPADLKEEAENCDSFLGAAPFPGKPDFYRNGPIAIEETTDAIGGWDVCRTRAGETLTWREVPLEGRVHLLVRAATTAAGGKLHFVIDGKTYPSAHIPSAGSGRSWTTVDTGAYTFARRSDHTISLVWDTPNISVNWWQVEAVKNVH